MEIPTDVLKDVEASLLEQLLVEHLELLAAYNDLRASDGWDTDPEGPIVARVRAALSARNKLA